MSDKGQIATLLNETRSAKTCIDKLSKDLAFDPDNETVRRLLSLSKQLYERRVELLAERGVAANDDGRTDKSCNLGKGALAKD
jgi:hypothetical protein